MKLLCFLLVSLWIVHAQRGGGGRQGIARGGLPSNYPSGGGQAITAPPGVNINVGVSPGYGRPYPGGYIPPSVPGAYVPRVYPSPPIYGGAPTPGYVVPSDQSGYLPPVWTGPGSGVVVTPITPSVEVPSGERNVSSASERNVSAAVEHNATNATEPGTPSAITEPVQGASVIPLKGRCTSNSVQSFCGADMSCCEDYRHGSQCYKTSEFNCNTVAPGLNLLCLAQEKVCEDMRIGPVCYDEKTHRCVSLQDPSASQPDLGQPEPILDASKTSGFLPPEQEQVPALGGQQPARPGQPVEAATLLGPGMSRLFMLCGAKDDACLDLTLGPVCFDPNLYQCTSKKLCPKGYQPCLEYCYDPAVYRCTNNVLFSGASAAVPAGTPQAVKGAAASPEAPPLPTCNAGDSQCQLLRSCHPCYNSPNETFCRPCYLLSQCKNESCITAEACNICATVSNPPDICKQAKQANACPGAPLTSGAAQGTPQAITGAPEAPPLPTCAAGDSQCQLLRACHPCYNSPNETFCRPCYLLSQCKNESCMTAEACNICATVKSPPDVCLQAKQANACPGAPLTSTSGAAAAGSAQPITSPVSSSSSSCEETDYPCQMIHTCQPCFNTASNSASNSASNLPAASNLPPICPHCVALRNCSTNQDCLAFESCAICKILENDPSAPPLCAAARKANACPEIPQQPAGPASRKLTQSEVPANDLSADLPASCGDKDYQCQVHRECHPCIQNQQATAFCAQCANWYNCKDVACMEREACSICLSIEQAPGSRQPLACVDARAANACA